MFFTSIVGFLVWLIRSFTIWFLESNSATIFNIDRPFRYKMDSFFFTTIFITLCNFKLRRFKNICSLFDILTVDCKFYCRTFTLPIELTDLFLFYVWKLYWFFEFPIFIVFLKWHYFKYVVSLVPKFITHLLNWMLLRCASHIFLRIDNLWTYFSI